MTSSLRSFKHYIGQVCNQAINNLQEDTALGKCPLAGSTSKRIQQNESSSEFEDSKSKNLQTILCLEIFSTQKINSERLVKRINLVKFYKIKAYFCLNFQNNLLLLK